MADQGGMEGMEYLLHDRPPIHLSGVRRGKIDCLMILLCMHIGSEGCLVFVPICQLRLRRGLMKEEQSVVCCPDKWRSDVRIYLSTGA